MNEKLMQIEDEKIIRIMADRFSEIVRDTLETCEKHLIREILEEGKVDWNNFESDLSLMLEYAIEEVAAIKFENIKR